jgi:hypothetical protein
MYKFIVKVNRAGRWSSIYWNDDYNLCVEHAQRYIELQSEKVLRRTNKGWVCETFSIFVLENGNGGQRRLKL